MKKVIIFLTILSLNIIAGDKEKKEREEITHSFSFKPKAGSIKINLKDHSIYLEKPVANKFELFNTLIQENPDIKEIDAKQANSKQLVNLLTLYDVIQVLEKSNLSDKIFSESLLRYLKNTSGGINELKDDYVTAQYLGASSLILQGFARRLAELIHEEKFSIEQYEEMFPAPVVKEIMKQYHKYYTF